MCHNLDLAITGLRDVDGVAEIPNPALHLDLIMQKLFKGGEVENLVADRLGAVDGVLGGTKSQLREMLGIISQAENRTESKLGCRQLQCIPSWSPLQACLFVSSAHHEILSLLFMKPSPHKAGGEQQSGNIHTVIGAIPKERRGHKEIDILRLGSK